MVREICEKIHSWHNWEDKRKTEQNANEWLDSIDLKVVFHKLLSKSSHLLTEAITGSNLHAGKNRKDGTFSSQNAITLYPLDIMFASTTLHVGQRETTRVSLCPYMKNTGKLHLMSLKMYYKTYQYNSCHILYCMVIMLRSIDPRLIYELYKKVFLWFSSFQSLA